MLIRVDRYLSGEDTTLSNVFIDGEKWCVGLEDEYREIKVPGKTRISEGEYKVTLRTSGGMSPRYAKRFPEMHQGMLHIRDVPNFTFVYIHIGNTHLHTEGCLLVGSGANEDAMTIFGSKDAYVKLYEEVVADAAAGTLKIVYTND